jgi:hypothetical protein
MVEGLSKINYRGKEILYLDYSGFIKDRSTQKQKTLQLMNGANEEYKKSPPNSVLGMGNFTNFSFDMDILTALKKSNSEMSCYIKKSAIVGVKGLLKAGYNFVIGLTNQKTRAFETEEEAKEWLVSDQD